MTTHEVLEEEKRMIGFARDQRGTRIQLGRKEHAFKRDWLNEQQRAAVMHVLSSRDTVMGITGGAGTGKSSLMEEAVEAIRLNDKEVFVFAPSTGGREVLQEKGFQAAQTLEHFMRNEKLQEAARGQVLWIDEAGLADVRSMNRLFDIAKQSGARVVLSGDTRQHSSPRRGEAMRLLENEAGLSVARVDAVQRQKGQYKRAVELVSLGQQVVDRRTGMTGLEAGFDLLDKLGKVKEIGSADRHKVLASHYIKSIKGGYSQLVVAPTHAEGRGVTNAIRDKLRETGAIGKEEHEFGGLNL